jgi:signal transduction histidine kinase
MKEVKTSYRPGFSILFGAWTLFALFMLVQSFAYRTRVGQEINLPVLLVGEFSYAYLWLALTPVVLWLGDRFRIEKSTFLPFLGVHAVAGAIISAVHKISSGIVYELARSAQGATFSWENQFQGVLAYLDYGLLIYWIILLLKYSLDYYRRYRDSELTASRLEAQLARAHLETLRMQLHPHFLFNTLNAISVLIDRDPEDARKTLGRLSDLLRLTLEYDGVQEVPLEREIDFLDRYLAIEKTRFGDRLTVRVEVDPEVMHAPVPAMILQPLVENAIRHGINRQRGPGVVEICASRTNGTLCLRVRDNGAGMQDLPDRKGVGLTNTRERLQRMYGTRFLLDVRNNEGPGVTAIVEIPFRNDPGLQ